MTYLEYLDDQELSDLWLDSDDDMALMLGAIKPWQIDGQPLSDDLEQWFEDNWNLDVPCQAFVPQDWRPVTSTTRFAREDPAHPPQ